MATDKETVDVGIEFPWWSEIYLALIEAAIFVGLPIDPQRCAQFLCDHAKFDVK